MQKRFCLSTFVATVTTTLMPTVFEARFDLSRIICRKKPKNFLGTKTSTCTALDDTKPRAPVWRICCGNRDLESQQKWISPQTIRSSDRRALDIFSLPRAELLHLGYNLSVSVVPSREPNEFCD